MTEQKRYHRQRLLAPPCGTATPVAALSPLMKPTWGKGIIYSDRLNHRSIVEGCMLAEAYSFGEVSVQRYRHRDANHLERLLRKSNGERKMIVTDGVFSLHGHIGQAIIRVNIMASHTRAHLDRLLNALEEIGRREGLIENESSMKGGADEIEEETSGEEEEEIISI